MSTTGRPSVVLDSGGLATLADPRRRYRLRALLELVADGRAELVTPAPTLTETVTGTARDASLNRLLRAVEIIEVGPLLAREAGALRHRARRGSATDAIVAAVAVRTAGSVVVTSDPEDLGALVGRQRSVRVHLV